MPYFLRRFLIVITLLGPALLASHAALAQSWLIRISDTGYSERFSHLTPLYTFADQDRLLSVKQADLLPFFADSQVRYIEPDALLQLEEPVQLQEPMQLEDPVQLDEPAPLSERQQKSGLLRAAQAATEVQDGLAIAGFSQLSASERQCDAMRVAVLDSGVDTRHAALSHVLFSAPFDVLNPSANMNELFWHGTHVTGILAAKPSENSSVQGACSSAQVMPIRFLGSTGGGKIADAVTGIRWAIDNQANIINHSWTVTQYSQALWDVMKEADQLGIIQIVAAGNSGLDLERDDFDVYPAEFAAKLPAMLAVANWDNANQRLNSTSNFNWAKADLAAPGTHILSLAPNNATRTESGTSMAVPFVSAASAMLWQQNPNWSAGAVVSALVQQSQASAPLVSRVRQGRRLSVANFADITAIDPQVLSIERVSGEFRLAGHRLDEVSAWRYRSAAQNSTLAERERTLTPLQSSESLVSFSDWDMPAGWLEWQRSGGEWQQLEYLPEAPAPINLYQQSLERGELLTWQGSDYVSEYQIYRTSNKSYKQKIASVSGVTNQYLDSEGSSDASYQVRLVYRIEVGGSEFELTSPLSESSSDSVGEVIQVGPVPVGQEAWVSFFVDEASVDLAIVEDAQNLVQAVVGNRVRLATDVAKTGQITVKNRLTEARQMALISIAEGENWGVSLSGQPLLLDLTSAQLSGAQQITDGRILLSGQWLAAEGGILLRPEQANYQFTQAKVISSSGEREVILTNRGQSLAISTGAIANAQSAAEQSDSFQILLEMSVSPLAVAGEKRSDSRCFLAKSLFADQPQTLAFYRHFRDEVLLNLPGGDWLVAQYYHWSPRLVVWAEEHPWFKAAMRWVLG
ncbi:S8 family serine peptidase [Vibrio navarrensis]